VWFSWFSGSRPQAAPALGFAEPTFAILCWFSGFLLVHCLPVKKSLSNVGSKWHLLVQCWFRMKKKPYKSITLLNQLN
jgi:hypothetical protein